MRAYCFDMDELVSVNDLKEVKSPNIFERGGMPHPEGLLSTVIFGNSVKERRYNHGYIDLYKHFFTPQAYIAIHFLFRGIDRIISGTSFYKLVDGKITVCPETAKDAKTGLESIYEDWEKIKWERSKDVSSKRNENIDFLTIHTKNELFVTKVLVLPVFYRDIDTSQGNSGVLTNDELNNYYSQLIRYVSLIRSGDMFEIMYYGTHMKIQSLMMDIYNYFKKKVEKKNGMIRKFLLGKNTTYAVRSVITGPIFHAEHSRDLLSKIDQTPIPLAQVVAELYPFIIHWLREYFDRTVLQHKEIDVDGEMDELESPERILNDRFYQKMCNRFIKDTGSRFNTFELKSKKGKSIYLKLRGKIFDRSSNAESPNFERNLTYCDVLYLAAMDAVKGKHVVITRYPVLDHTGIFPSHIFVSSTIKTQPVLINGIVYEHYPVIDLNIRKDLIASLFVDSIVLSASLLPRLDGDFDGDQVTSKIIWSQEANAELEQLMNSKKFLMNVTGEANASIESEAVQTLYVLSKDPNKSSRVITEEEKKELMEKNVKDMTLQYLTSLFMTGKKSTDRFDTRVIPPRFRPYDIIKFKKEESPSGEAMDTTVGRYIIYRVLIEFCGLEKVVPYMNYRINNKFYKQLDRRVSNALMRDQITIDIMKKYIDQRDWFLFSLHSVVCNSYTPEVIKTPKEVVDLKKEIIKKYDKEIKAGNISVSEKIEKELIDKTKKILGDNTGMDLYISGARGSIDNNLKDINLYKGAIADPYSGKYQIVTSSFMDGIKKEDIPPIANANVTGSYPKAVETAVSGYLGKQMISLLQTFVLGSKGSDCGSVGSLDVVIDQSFIDNNLFLYRYIIENGKLVRLDESNINQYKGKKVKMRSPMYCKRVENGKMCNMCCGDQYYLLDIPTIGLMCMRIAGTLTNAHMKKFHSNLIKVARFDVDRLLC